MSALLTAFLLFSTGSAAQELRISPKQAQELGRRIWKNECGNEAQCLVWWNKGEEFASVGIGHFLWYPPSYHGPFIESFPKLLIFLEKNGVALPAWLKGSPPCPWNSREALLADGASARMRELHRLLKDTVPLQARFEADRLEASLPKMLESLPSESRESVRRQFYRVAESSSGLYALMDYVNFKGEGTSPTERYHDQGWGLLQVLQGMSGDKPGPPALEEFVRSAEQVLKRRVSNSPPERNEARWIPIWTRRLQTYL